MTEDAPPGPGPGLPVKGGTARAARSARVLSPMSDMCLRVFDRAKANAKAVPV